ncbi:MAG: hypothetical protein KAJ63_09810 [Methyloprofundus sp.]|nr:hypothetical protein [Methyloprofundus sp.]
MKKILILVLFLTYSLQVFSDNLSDSNKLFNWAEENYSQYFNPPGRNTFKIENYRVRYYKNTDVYMGTLGEDVYVYGEVFNGLKHVGRIGDFIDVTDNETKTVDNIKIIGSHEFITQTEAALELLKNLAPLAFEKTQKYIGIIEQGQYSHMWANEISPRYEVDDMTSFYSIKWHAGAIAHEATHSELYHEYQAKHGLPVPANIWSSVDAEKFCIQYQIDVMKKMNAPQFDIDYLSELDGTGSGCDIDGNCD